MTKIYQIILTFFIANISFGQCTNASQYGSATASGTAGTTVTISTCSFQSEYSPVSGIVSGSSYTVNYSLGGCITIHSGSATGPIVSFGSAPLTFTATSSGTYYVTYNTSCNPCGTATSCGTSTITSNTTTSGGGGGGTGTIGGVNCSTMAPICTQVGLNYIAQTGVPAANITNPGNNYGCLFSQPNPTWYYLNISTNGAINMALSAPSDIDYIVYGPYSSLAAATNDCNNMGVPAGEIVSCSYSGTSNELPSIPNAVAGQVYAMLITNYASVVQNVTLVQTSGSGGTSCLNCAITALTATPSACNASNQYSVSGTVTVTSPPTSGTLTVSNSCGGLQIFNAPFTSPIAYNLAGLTPNGATCTVTASFSAIPACTLTHTYASPVINTPTFATFGPYCQCAAPGILPTTSTNGITGTWSPSTISTAVAGTIVYTFTPTAGQCAVAVTKSIVTNPIIVTMPANGGSTVACPVNSNTSPTPPTVVDNCARTLTVSAPVISALPACSGTRTYTYTYTNACGTTYSWVYTYTISAPTVVMPANGSSTVACPALAVAPTAPIVLDNCGRTLTVSAPVISAAVACSGSQTYTYTYTSCSGTTYPWVYTYTISAPTVVMPANGSSTVACPALAVAPTAPIVLDNCGRTLAVSSPVISAAVACSGSQTYTYTYTSCSGTTYPWVYTYTISSPTVVMPANGSSTVACPALVVAPTAPTVVDNCGRTLSVSAPIISAAVACTGTQTYTYTYTSCSGTSYPWVYTYTISAPTVVMPANGSSTVACPALAVAPTAPTVLDNCGRTLTVSAPVISAAVACSGTQTYTYTYTSCSGTTYPWVYTYTISAPTVVMPANGSSTVACPALAVAPTAPIVLDNCGRTLTVSAPVISAAVACSGTQTYTYTYTSCSGTTYPWVYTYTISAPTVVMPANGSSTVACPALAVAPTAPIVLDNCGRTLAVSTPVISAAVSCSGTQTYTYTYTSCSGTTYPWVYTYTINDNILPTASNPAAISVTNGLTPVVDLAVVINEADNCSTPTVAWVSDVSNGGTCPEIITRTFSVTDACGNQLLVTQTISVGDAILPTASNPVAVNVQCIGDVPLPNILVVTNESDNQGVPVVAFVSDVSNGLMCPETITRTYSVTDICNNVITVTQLITVHDTQVPVLATPPAAVSVQCATDVPAMTALSWTDNCTGLGSVTGTDGALVGGTCGGTITRTWTYSDLCGNIATTNQIITVHDTQVPVLATPPAAVTVDCIGAVPAMTNLSWTDNCTGAGSVTGTDGALVGGACGGTITRTWTYTDLCGNIATTTQTITIDDNTLPTASNPATITVPGGPVPAVDVLVVINEADNCSVPVVAFVSESTDGGTCPETITRIYSVTDACGNTINVTHIILITDPIFPTASNPVALNVQCIGDVPAPNILVVTNESDNQGVPVVAFVSDISNGLTCPETITRTYSVTDICNNVITVTQLITVHDTQVPVFTAPPVAVSVQCATDVPAMTALAWTDNCTGAGSVTGTDGALVGGACGGTITRTWTYTDLCGNVAATTQIITVHDTQVPVLATPPAAVSVQCATDVPAMTTLSWTDNCTGSGSVTGTDGALVGGACGGTITRTWTYTDLCGNIATTTQIITVHDTQVPVLATPPAAVTVDCIGTVPAMTTLAWTDNCTGAGSVTGTDGALVGGACGGTITRTWTYTDLCGNIATTTQTITIDDNTLPTASNPATITVPGGPVPAVDVLVVINEADNCSVPVVAFVSESTDGGTCPETITRIYSVTDACGNTINVTHILLITDPIFPTASNPVALNVQCIGDVPAPNILVVTNESDNQGVPVVAFVSDISNGLTCPETITRTYSVTDICNNVITVTQTITVHDIIAPTASNPASINIQTLGGLLSSMAVPIDVLVVTDELDNCSVPVVAWLSDVSDGNTCPEIITRTYTVTDACGNVTNVTQTITVDDITNPTASNPIGINVQCIGDVPIPNVAVVTNEADNGTSFPLVTFVSDVSDGNTCPETITRTYSVADDCGNSINVTQLITVNDITNPTASNPANISVPGSVNVPAPNIADVINEADNCTANPIVAWVSDVSDGNVCNLEEITRTYSVTDDCGNQILVTQVITILAVIPPINAGLDQLICLGDLTTLTATNALSVPISWDNGVVDGQSFSPAISTNYTVTANNLGCINSDQVTITINPPAVVSFTSDVNFGCAPLTVNFTNLTANSVNCVWTSSGGQIMNGTGTVATTFTQTGCFDITLTSTGIDGCATSFTAPNFICVEETPIAAFQPSSVMLSASNTEVVFDNNSIGATNYSWNFGDNSSVNTDESPTYYYSSNNDSYQVMLIASTPFGCADTAYSQITVFEDLLYYVPNTFTPDEDNFNATFQPVFTSGFDPFDFTLLIFNRWGEIIFESHDATIGWDGTYGNNNQMVQDGTYTWKIEFKTSLNDERKIIFGSVNVIR